jgi:ribosomal protein L35AE/L33A
MATPVVNITSVKTTYNNDETIDVTVNWTDADAETLVFTGKVTDSAGNIGQANITFTITDPATAAGSSLPARSWVKVSETANSATFRATA